MHDSCTTKDPGAIAAKTRSTSSRPEYVAASTRSTRAKLVLTDLLGGNFAPSRPNTPTLKLRPPEVLNSTRASAWPSSREKELKSSPAANQTWP